MDRFPNEIIPVNVWADRMNKLIAQKVKKRQTKQERLKILK